PPIVLDMMNMMRKSMERMIDLVPSALMGAEEWAANDTGRDNGSSKETCQNGHKTSNISQVSQPSEASAEKGPSSNDGGDAVHPRDAPRVLASQLDPSRPKAENASWGSANAMAPAEGFSAACYGLFLRHGLLLLVLAVVCGVSCLLGTLLPVVCDSRSSGQRSQYPAKKYWSPHRIFADPALVRMFRRKEATMA
ncbi:hypothetical protein HPB47_003773, partial [Ixodes persulcatus]